MNPRRSKAYLTRDKGASWQVCCGLPKNIRVIADKVDSRRFYAVDAVAEILYSSEDGGMTFHADTLNLTVKGSNAVMLVLPYEEEIRVEGKTVSTLLPVMKKICGLAAYDGLYRSAASEKFDFRALDKVRTIYALVLARQSPRQSIILPST